MVMEISLSAYNPQAHVQPRKPSRTAPQFSGLVDGFSNLVGFIDSSRLAELMASDGIGMILPRTVMAYDKRGPDDGRETFLREAAGLVGNVLLTGWLGHGVMKLLGNNLNGATRWYNPKGINHEAWVNAANLDAFSQLYKQALHSMPDPTAARHQFVKGVLGGMKSHNPQFIFEALRKSLEILPEEKRPAYLQAMLNRSLNPSEATQLWKQLQGKPLAQQLKQLEDPDSLFHQNSGKLSQAAQEELAKYYLPKTVLDLPENKQLREQLGLFAGTEPLDNKAAAHLKHLEKQPELADRLKNQAFRQKEFQKLRFNLAKDGKQAAEKFLEAVDQVALNKGLTGTVNLTDLSKGQSRRNVLQSLKFFLEHYVDRAAFEAKQEGLNASEQIQAIDRKLFAPAQSGFLHQLFPKAEDGLVNAAIKSKTAYTWMPIALSIAAAAAFTFYNQHLTAKKHGGQVFFPGEGDPAKALKANPFTAPFQPFRSNKNFQPTMGFQQTTAPNGGILA